MQYEIKLFFFFFFVILKHMFGNGVNNCNQTFVGPNVNVLQNNNNMISSSQYLFEYVITKIMPYTKTKWGHEFGRGVFKDGEHTFRDLLLTLDLKKLQNDIGNNEMNIEAYRNNLTHWLNQNNTGIEIVDGTYGTGGAKAKKLDNNTVRIVDAAGDFVVDFSMQKITFYRIADGDGAETQNFFSTNATTQNIQRIEYDFNKNDYVIFSTTADGERRWNFNLLGNNKISNITFHGHGIDIDFNTSSGENKSIQFAVTGREKSDFRNFCTKEGINASLQLMNGNGYEGGYSEKEQPDFCTRCWNFCTENLCYSQTNNGKYYY